MSRRLHPYSVGVAMAAFALPWRVNIHELSSSDPFIPRARSKGEKARNRKLRGGRP